MANKLVSIVPSGTNNYLTPSLSFNRIATDLLSAGVVGAVVNTSGVAPATGSMAVNAQGSPNMTVAVSSGTAYVTATPTGGTAQIFAVNSDSSENVTISANSTGGTRYDFLYVKLDPDKLNNPASTGTDVATFITQRSTTTPTDSNGAPANSLLLAIVTVANSAASISNANIADSRVQMAPIVVPTGGVVQQVTSTYSAVVTGTTVMPIDDTIPQSTEGDQYMTVAITPKAATNLLIIEAVGMWGTSVAQELGVALFQDSTASALATTLQLTTNSSAYTVPLMYSMTAGTTSSTTFKIRAGGGNAGTNTFNGKGAARLFGTAAKSFMRVTEVKV